MALRINDSEYYAIDAHSHLGRRKTPLGHGVASFLGDDLVRNLDEAGLDCAVAFPLGASDTNYSEATKLWRRKWRNTQIALSVFAALILILARRLRRKT